MRTISTTIVMLATASLLAGCGKGNGAGGAPQPAAGGGRDALTGTSWAMTEADATMGAYFGDGGTFLWASTKKKTATAIYAMGARGTYVIGSGSKLTFVVKTKSCPTITVVGQSLTFELAEKTLKLGNDFFSLTFDRAPKGLEAQYPGAIEWGCLDDGGNFTPHGWE